MTSRERVINAINHKKIDKIPLDLGSTTVTGIHVSSLHKLKVALGIINPKDPIRVEEPFQMLGEVDEPLRKALGIDTIPLIPRYNFFGFKNENWKYWEYFDGTPLLVPEKFNTKISNDGYIYQYPKGDKTSSPSLRMPKNGYYHDAIMRQKPFEEESLRVKDQIEEFQVLDEEDLLYYQNESKKLFETTDYAIISSGVPGTNLGDISHVPGLVLKDPKGIRDIEEWYVSLITRRDYIREVFTKISEIGLKNLKLFKQAVGDRIQVILVSATDFGAQNCPLISPNLYRDLFKPFHALFNDWIHKNTNWKTFIHTCGSNYDLLPDYHEAGFDILNPIQISADKMDPENLKKNFGSSFVFWGGGVNTQKTLPFGSSEEVAREVEFLIKTFRQGGGFVFSTVHNIQSNIPVENIISLFNSFNKNR